MKILKSLLIGLTGLIALLCVVGLFLPDSSHVERRILIKTSPERVFEHLNSFKRFNDWSPWYKKDPQARYRWSGPDSGVGAQLAWTSEEVGNGRQTIIASEAPTRITMQLDFGEQGKAQAFFRITAQPDGTSELVWGFDSQAHGNLVARYMGLLMDPLLGPDYERGLAKLKTLLEQSVRS